MLQELKIKDFAIVDDILVEFDKGFNTLTGETGAGKSILIEALGIVLGGRPSEEMIKTGRQKAVVEARFDVSDTKTALLWLEEQGLDDGSDLIVRRILTRNGKNKVFINGGLATAGQLKEVGSMMVDTHGQHETQTLFNTEAHLPFLDTFLNLEKDVSHYQKKFATYRILAEKIRKIHKNRQETERRIDLLKFQVNEIVGADLKTGENKSLESERSRLSNAEKLIELSSNAVSAMDEDENCSASLLAKAIRNMEKINEIDNCAVSALETARSALLQLEESAGNLKSYAGSLERDPARLETVDDRLELIKSLTRKYGNTIDDIVAFGKKAEHELNSIELNLEQADELEDELLKLGQEVSSLALSLDVKRSGGSSKFSNAVAKELKALNMEKATLACQFVYEESPESPCLKENRNVELYPYGIGKMEILFSSNPGEPPKPLSKIASGGEISRVMLSLKTILANKQPRPTMIFDEIDAGIGGTTGDRLGEKMRSLAENCQVFCVTHLAQVARKAHTHYSVEKKTTGDKTKVSVVKLDNEGRIKELARMAGGSGATETALKWAEEALKEA